MEDIGEERKTSGTPENTETTKNVASEGDSSPRIQKEEEQKKSSTPERTREEVPTQQPASSGWGWGNLWNAAANVVTQSVDQYVKPTINTVSETTSQFVKELIDEPQEVKFPRPPPESAETKPTTPEMIKSEKAEPKEEEEDFFSSVDKSILSAVDYLGGYLQEGIKVAKSSDIGAKAKGALQKAKEVASNATEEGLKLGEKLAVQSVDTLEAVGKSALTFLTVQEEDGKNRKRIRPIFLSAQTAHMTQEEQQNFEDTLNKNYFEENKGLAYLGALETLSINCTVKVQQLEQQLDSKKREELFAMVNVIKKLLDVEDEEGKQIELPSIKLSEQATKQNANLNELEQEIVQKAKQFVESYKAEIKELKPADSPDSIITPTDICHLTASYLDKILLETVQKLNQFSAAGVEQLLRVVESFIIDSDNGLTTEQAVERATYLFNLALLINERITKSSTVLIDGFQEITEAGKSECSQLGKKPEYSDDSKKCMEDLDTKMSLHVNHVYLETSNSVANLEDCRKFLFSISKSMLVTSLVGSAQVKSDSKEEVQDS